MPKQFANFRNLILLLPLTVRLAAIWYWHDYDRMENISHGDAIEYVTLAKGLHDHGVLTYGVQDVWGLPKILDDSNPVPTTGRAPLYPAVLSLFYQGDQSTCWPRNSP